ncbi:hypothetical protein [Actinokineospora sp.]|uniref:hypothetical protein n=1 Tax=Actinokineospora sp. TaxID=1872133 RepID=UPI0040377EAA
MAFMWLVLPTGWPTLLTIIVAFSVADTADSEEWLAVAIPAVLAAALWWLGWRFMGRSCTRLPDGLLVRGFRRSYRVPWTDVVDVSSTEFESVGRSFSFSQVRVTFRRPGDGRVITVKVASSYRSGSVGRDTVQSWLPGWHPQHRRLPEPAPWLPGGVGLARLPVLTSLRPPGYLVAIYLALIAGFAVACVVGAVACLRYDGTAWAVVATVLLLLAVAALWPAARAFRARVELTAAGLVNHGYFHTVAFAAVGIEGFVLVPSGAGGAVRVVLAGRGSRQLAVGAGFGGHPEQTLRELERWHAAVA